MANIISAHIPPRLNVTLTWVYLILVLILSAGYWWDYTSTSNTERFSDPVSVVADSLGPELEYFEALQTLPAWQQRLLNFPGIERAEFVDQATKTWRQVIESMQTEEYLTEEHELHAAHIHLLVLLAEEQSWQAAETQLQDWENTNIESVAYLRSLYNEQKFLERPEYFPIDAYENGWTDLRIKRRAAQLSGDDELLNDITTQMQSRNNRQLQRTVAYSIIWWTLMIAGILIMLVTYRRMLTPAAQYNIAWPGMDAIGVFVRAELLMTIVLLLEGYLYLLRADFSVDEISLSIYDAWPSLWRGLIALGLIYFFLIRPRQATIGDVFGLSLQRVGGFIPLLFWIIALYSIDNLGTLFFSSICDALDCESPWAEGLSETILWGTTTEVVLEGIDAVVWAPIFEEIVFRGVLYLGFRQWLSPITAALLSAMIFAFLHFYSLPGFIGVMWTGFIFAIAFEYSRSLLPAIGAHMLTNLHWLLYSVVFYR